MEPESEWRDGFLFLGNELSLDFLNTRPEVGGELVELLPDSGALLRWLVAAELLSKRKAKKLAKTWAASGEGQIRALHEFREAYRKIILKREAGRSLTPAYTGYLNELLKGHRFTDQIGRAAPGAALTRGRLFEPRRPLDALGPILDAAVDLLVNGDPERTRKCAGCVLHFADTSKKGTRRWCSMQICGNRAKVAAYARRRRE